MDRLARLIRGAFGAPRRSSRPRRVQLAPGWRRPSPRLVLRPSRPPSRLLALALLLPLLVGIAGPATTSGNELSDAQAKQKALAAQIAAQRAQVAKLKAMQVSLSADIASTQVALNGINQDLAATKVRITKVSQEIAVVQATYADLVRQVDLLNAQIDSLRQDQVATAQALADRKAMLAARVREAYRTDRTPLVQQLLTAGSISDVFQDVGDYLDLGSQDQAIAAQIQQDQQTLTTLGQTLTASLSAKQDLVAQTVAQKQLLDAQAADLKAAKAHLAALQKQTNQQLAIQRAAWAKIARNRTAAAAAIAADQRAQAKLQSKIRDLLAAQAQLGNIPSQYNGTLRWPMSGVITQEFGCTGFPSEPPLGSCAHFHEGIDIAAPMYTPIRAAADGVVVFAGPNPWDPYPKAWIVIIAHSDTLATWYAHVDNGSHSIPVVAGQHVSQGQVIAYEGMTGNTTGPHLHWAVMFNGNFANPRLFT